MKSPIANKPGVTPNSVSNPGQVQGQTLEKVQGQKLEKPVETTPISTQSSAPSGAHTGTTQVQTPVPEQGTRLYGLQAPRVKPRTGGRTSKVWRPKAELYKSAALKKNVRGAFQELYTQIRDALAGGQAAEQMSGLQTPLLAAMKQVSGLRKRAKDVDAGVAALAKTGLDVEMVLALERGRLTHDAALRIRDNMVDAVKGGQISAAEAKDALITLDDALLLFASTLGKSSKIGDFRYNHPQIGAGEAGNRASDVLNALASSMHR